MAMSSIKLSLSASAPSRIFMLCRRNVGLAKIYRATVFPTNPTTKNASMHSTQMKPRLIRNCSFTEVFFKIAGQL